MRGVDVRVILMLWLSMLATIPAAAAELLMVQDPHCGPCLLFERQLGPIYPQTEEGRRAPLRRIVYGQPPPAAYHFIGQPKVAPTFILVDGGVEIDRAEGYQTDELFWMNITSMMQKLAEPQQR